MLCSWNMSDNLSRVLSDIEGTTLETINFVVIKKSVIRTRLGLHCYLCTVKCLLNRRHKSFPRRRKKLNCRGVFFLKRIGDRNHNALPNFPVFHQSVFGCWLVATRRLAPKTDGMLICVTERSVIHYPIYQSHLLHWADNRQPVDGKQVNVLDLFPQMSKRAVNKYFPDIKELKYIYFFYWIFLKSKVNGLLKRSRLCNLTSHPFIQYFSSALPAICITMICTIERGCRRN